MDTLQALAAATADEIVDLAVGWPFRPDQERVREWIAQARRLLDTSTSSSGTDPSTQDDAAIAPADISPRVRHTFTLQVQTDEASGGEVLATKVIDVESQAFDTWSGWDAERLVHFVVHHSGLRDQAVNDLARSGERQPSDPTETPEPRKRAVWGFGVLNADTTVAGGRHVRAVLRLGPADTGAVADSGTRTMEWELVCGPAQGKAHQRLACRQLDLVEREPMVSAIDLVVPAQFQQARLAGVVRILGEGDQPPIAHVLSDTTLEVLPLP